MSKERRIGPEKTTSESSVVKGSEKWVFKLSHKEQLWIQEWSAPVRDLRQEPVIFS